MFKDVRNLTKQTSIYLIGSFASKLIGIILLPLYTKLLAVEAYGIYSLFEVTIQFGYGILTFGIPSSLMRWLSLEEHKKRQGSILFTSVIFLLAVSLFLLFAALISQTFLSHLLFSNLDYTRFFTIIALIIGAKLMNMVPLTLIRFEEKSIFFVTVTILRFVLQTLSTIYFVAGIKLGIIGIFYGQIIGESFTLTIMLMYMLKKLIIKIEFGILKQMVGFGFPLIFSGLSNQILKLGDRYILGFLTNMSVVGMYSLGYKFAGLIDTTIINSFRTSFVPLAWKKLKEKNAKFFYSKILTYYVFIVFWISLFISVYAKGLIHLLASNKSYWDAYKIVAIVVFAISIKGTFAILKMGLQFTKKTKYIAYIVLSAAVINIILNFLLIPYLQMYGAAIATFISFLYISVIGYIISNKFFQMKFEWFRITKIGITTCFIYSISIFLNPLPTSWRIITKLVCLTSYPVILYVLRFFKSEEMNRIKGAKKKWSTAVRLNKKTKI